MGKISSTGKREVPVLGVLKKGDNPEEAHDKFDAVKSVFLYSLNRDISAQEKILAYEIQKICMEITSSKVMQ